ncbi:MAG: cyclic nucleotide-binding domain-containing protein [Acidobacteriota bacterium]|nr:cyclic nucleotide-binding domain-containing protein [Acidobacteriota bacterium]
MSNRRPTLHNVSLLRLLCGFGLLNVSEWGFIAALSVHAYRTGGTLDVGLIGVRFLAGSLSSAILAPLLVRRRGILSVIALLRALLLGAAALMAIGGGPFVLVLLFVVLDAVAAAAYRPAQSRLLPSIARSPEELTSAVAGTSLAKTIGQAAGALLGGAAVEFVSPGTTMAGGAGVMLLALICTLGVAGAPTLESALPAGRLHDGLSAFPRVLGDAHAWPLVLASVLRTLVRGLWGALLVVVALHLLHAGSSSVGLLQAASGIGVLLALPVTVTQIGRSRLALPCLISFVAAGITVGLVSIASALAIVAVLVFIWGAAMALADATSLSLLHRLLPTEAFSRAVAVMESLKLLTEGAGALLAPALVALFGLRAALVIAGLPLPLLVVITWARVRSSDEFAAGRGAVVGRLHRVRLFRGLEMTALEQLAASAQPLGVQAGEEPVRQGEPGDRFYVIESGEADVLINGFRVRRLGAGDDFGERALLRSTPRTATVHALTDMQLLAIERDAFLQAVTGEAGVSLERRDLLGLPVTEVLRELPLFAGASDSALDALARAARRERIPAASVVFDAGEPSSLAYVILQGRVELLREGVVNSVLLPGDIFGELSLIHGTPRAERAAVTEDLVALVLPRASVLAASVPRDERGATAPPDAIATGQPGGAELTP